MKRLRTDYIDILMLHLVDDETDCDVVFDEGGLLGVAKRLRKEGKARMLGVSSHVAPVALKAVRSGEIDVLMFPVNPAMDAIAGSLGIEQQFKEDAVVEAGGVSPDRQELYNACAAGGVSIVAMKPYYAGILLAADNRSGVTLTPSQCLAYALDRPAVATTVPGCRTADEMRAALAYLEASDEERDYSAIHRSPLWKLGGSCTYCNHCLPCPEEIDIGGVTRLADIAAYQADAAIIAEYKSLPVTASACTECGVCNERCPFTVDAVANMQRAAEVFGD
jgi:predicted aldo/keto reductase-like oxidoreductase